MSMARCRTPEAILSPLTGAENQGNRTERPALLCFLAINAIGNPRVANVPGRQLEPATNFAVRIFGKVAQKIQPVITRPTHRVEELVRNACERLVISQPLAQTLCPRRIEVGTPPGLARHVRGHGRRAWSPEDQGSSGTPRSPPPAPQR